MSRQSEIRTIEQSRGEHMRNVIIRNLRRIIFFGVKITSSLPTIRPPHENTLIQIQTELSFNFYEITQTRNYIHNYR